MNTPTCSTNPTAWNFSTNKTYMSFGHTGGGTVPCSTSGGSTSFTAYADPALNHCAVKIWNYTAMYTDVYFLARTPNCTGWAECRMSGIR